MCLLHIYIFNTHKVSTPNKKKCAYYLVGSVEPFEIISRVANEYNQQSISVHGNVARNIRATVQSPKSQCRSSLVDLYNNNKILVTSKIADYGLIAISI